MKYFTYASALVSIAAATALAGNDHTGSPGGLALEYINASPLSGTPGLAPLLQGSGQAIERVKFPAGIRWNPSDAAKFQTPVASSIRLPGLTNHTLDGGMNRGSNDFSNILLSGMLPTSSPVPVGGSSGNGASNTPVTVPLPSGAAMGIIGAITIAAAARRRAARGKSL